MKKIVTILSIFCGIAQSSWAQDETDGLSLGYVHYHGTARSMATANAQGSIGADFSAATVNPAGIAIFKTSEFCISPMISNYSTATTYGNKTETTNVGKFGFSQLGIVITNPRRKNNRLSDWQATTFAIGINKLADFNKDYSYTGTTYTSSLIERYAEEFNALGGINAVNSVSEPAYAAYDTWLIDKNYGGDTTLARAYVPYWDGLQQTKTVSERGGLNEFVLSMAGNYRDKVMLGATIGLQTVNHRKETAYEEKDISGDLTNNFSYVTINQNIAAKGIGINAKLGIIIKPVPYFRAGIALHTPTAYSIEESSDFAMESNTDSLLILSGISSNPVSLYKQDSTLISNYTVSTPYKAIASASFLFNKYGFVTADIEYVNYTTLRMNFGNGYETETKAVRNVIKALYKSTINLRLGAEVKIENFALRAGIAMYGSPYATPIGNNTPQGTTLLSGGIGYRAKGWYLDGTFVHGNASFAEQPYVLNRVVNIPTAAMKQTQNNAIITWGVRF